mmetsp:Transcript_1437/g.2152  ORF Transcript_1437/g.2152 Transcript_1437/m.2152 type:complete len:233 (-) Transcript_1437:481-1179(-)
MLPSSYSISSGRKREAAPPDDDDGAAGRSFGMELFRSPVLLPLFDLCCCFFFWLLLLGLFRNPSSFFVVDVFLPVNIEAMVSVLASVTASAKPSQALSSKISSNHDATFGSPLLVSLAGSSIQLLSSMNVEQSNDFAARSLLEEILGRFLAGWGGLQSNDFADVTNRTAREPNFFNSLRVLNTGEPPLERPSPPLAPLGTASSMLDAEPCADGAVAGFIIAPAPPSRLNKSE